VLMTADGDVSDAVKIARTSGADRVVLSIQGGKGWEHTPRSEIKPAEVATAAAVEKLREMDESDLVTPIAIAPEPAVMAPPAHVHVPAPPAPAPAEPELVLGIPKDLLLPASIGALAVVIIGVFTVSRMSSR
jgi:hypothetical protein